LKNIDREEIKKGNKPTEEIAQKKTRRELDELAEELNQRLYHRLVPKP